VKRHNFVCVRVNDGLEPLMQFNRVRKNVRYLSLFKNKKKDRKDVFGS